MFTCLVCFLCSRVSKATTRSGKHGQRPYHLERGISGSDVRARRYVSQSHEPITLRLTARKPISLQLTSLRKAVHM